MNIITVKGYYTLHGLWDAFTCQCYYMSTFIKHVIYPDRKKKMY